MAALDLPPEVQDVLRSFGTCEFTTMAKDGTPITWPTAPLYLEDRGLLMVASSIGTPAKIYNARRNPDVAMLFSEPKSSGLSDPPAVLVQGDAHTSEVETWNEDLKALWLKVWEWQPAAKRYSGNFVLRRLMGFYYMRVTIYLTPRKVTWWPCGDFSAAPHVLELHDVA